MRLRMAVFFGVLLAGWTLQPGASVAASSPATLTADRDGPIAEWILALGDGLHRAFLDTHARIIRSADAQSRIRVVYHSPAARIALEQRLVGSDPGVLERVRFIHSATDVPYFTRDLFVSGRRLDGSPVAYLPHASHYAALADGTGATGSALMRMVRSLVGEGAILTGVLFEGGAIVSDADLVFLSPSIFEGSLDAGLSSSAAALVRTAEEMFGRPVMRVDSSLVVLPDHIDLFLTPIGGRRVMLGDPMLGRRLLRLLGEEARTMFQKNLSELAVLSGDGAGAAALLRPEFFAALQEANGSADFVFGFQRIERQLKSLGYEVLRVPFLWCRTLPEAERLAISYNNVVLEDRGPRHIVYLPSFGLDVLDGAARTAWTGAGFIVKAIPCLGPAYFGGSVRCLTQVIRR